MIEGDRLTLDIGAVAHGGHCVARTDGRVVFVRHALPGERVIAEVTSIGSGGRFVRADAVEVLEASADRVPPPCPLAGPGRCGGCDWQHASLPAQRAGKAAVVREQLTRLGGLDPVALAALLPSTVPPARPLAASDGEAGPGGPGVEAVPGDREGLAWRTRQRWAVAADGTVGLHRHRSHEVVPVDRCPLVTDAVDSTDVTRRTWLGSRALTVVAPATGTDRLVVPDPPPGPDEAERADAVAGLPPEVAVAGARGRTWVTERAGERTWRVTGDGFWQVHPGAADALVATVRDLLGPRPGDHLLDLYAGVGLFAGSLAGDLGPGGRIDAVEADARACGDARRSMHDLPTVHIHHAPVDRWLATRAPRRCDLVVLDPPRSGAGAAVLARVLRLRPRAIAYVACDPAALGRDTGTLAEAGWALTGLRVLDIFPMTHHVESVAVFRPADALSDSH